MRIYKYKIEHGHNKIKVPKGSVPISVGAQAGPEIVGDEAVIYFTIPNGDPHDVLIHIIAFHTGEDFSMGGNKFIGTIMMDHGSYVLHVFQEL